MVNELKSHRIIYFLIANVSFIINFVKTLKSHRKSVLAMILNRWQHFNLWEKHPNELSLY